jgi:predicted O-linked N-acetylglucosamine transferase (SPINDLY family)
MNDVASLYQDALTKHQSGDVKGAECGYRAVLAIASDHPGACHFLGVILLSRRQLTESLEYFERALSFNGSKAVFHNNYGVALKELNRLDNAHAAFEKAVSLSPNYADAHANLGLVALLRDKLDEAKKHLLKALEIQNDHTDAKRHLSDMHFRLGSLHARNRRFAQAQSEFEEAVRLAPDTPAARLALGSCLADQDEFEDAELMYRRAARLPNGRQIWTYKRLGFCPTTFENESQIEEFWTNLNSELDKAVSDPPPMDWKTLPLDGFTPSFNLPHLNKCCREIKEKFAAFFAKAFPQESPVREKKDRPCLGFVVGEGHELGFQRVMNGILNGLDRTKFDVKLFCAERSKAMFREAIPFSDRFDAAVDLIRSHRCDFLYHWKVGGGTFDWFLPFAKCAPVQCTGFGTHGTSGVGVVDWYLSSAIVETAEADRHYTENLYRLPSYATFHVQFPRPQHVKRSEFPIPEKGTLYFCPHRIAKYHPMFDEYVKQILDRDSKGTLLMTVGGPDRLRERLQTRMARHLGETLMNRIVYFASLPSDPYYRLLSLVDVVLDSPVYAGDLTTHDAFSYGIPVVTQRNELLVQRNTTGLYELMEISEMAVDGRDAYVDLAVRLGTDPDYRRSVSQKIVNRSKPLFGNDQLVRDFETFVEQTLIQ